MSDLCDCGHNEEDHNCHEFQVGYCGKCSCARFQPMNDKQSHEGILKAHDVALQKLCKWRTVLVGWLWGSKAKTDPGVQGMRDLMDQQLIRRVELSAVTALLIEKGVFSTAEYLAQVTTEAHELDKMLEKLFDGYRTTDAGIAIDTARAQVTNQRLGFPP